MKKAKPTAPALSTALADWAPAGGLSCGAGGLSQRGQESNSRKPLSVTGVLSDCQLGSKEHFKSVVWGHSAFTCSTSHCTGLGGGLGKLLSLATRHVVRAAPSAANTAFIPGVMDLEQAILKH